MSDSTSTIEEEKLVSIIGGTIKDLKEYVEEEKPDSKLLNRLLEDEKAAKDRKTAKKYLRQKIKERKIGGDFQKAQKELEDVQNTLEHIREQEIGTRDFNQDETEDIDSVEEIGLIEGDFEDVKEFINERNPSVEKARELIEGEKKAQDRKSVKNLLNTFIRQKKLHKDISNAEYHIGKVREDFAEIEEESEYISPDLLEDHEPHEAVKQDMDERSEEDEASEEIEEEKTQSEDKDGSSEKRSKDDPEFEEKKALLEDLDVEMDDEKLREIDKAQLEALKDEKSEREKLIDDLKEIGMDEDELRSSSTEDLKTLKEELDGSTEESSDSESEEDLDEDRDDSDKDEKDIEEEAEEDLEMLMGSVKNSESEDTGRDPFDQLKDMKDQFKDLWNRPDEEQEEETGIEGDKVIDLLDHYEKQPEKEQAIKTAHVMKGFLEYRMDIDREMTYEELAKTLGDVEKADDDIRVLQDFFERMSKDEYTDQIHVENMDQVIESSKVVIEELN